MNGNLFIHLLQDAKAGRRACAAINVLNYNTTRAVIHAARSAGQPIILQPSTGTVKHYGVTEMFQMLDTLRQHAGVPVSIHLDHCRDVQLAADCVDAGWDSIMMDYSTLPLEENIRLTQEMTTYAHARGAAVEGEVGVIAGVEDEISHDCTRFASYEETAAFLKQTGVDAIAPAIGTAHGLYKGIPVLNFELLEQLMDQPVPVVVHGGTGLPKSDFQKLIEHGAAKINLSTVLKQVYLGETRRQLQNQKLAPVELDSAVEIAVQTTLEPYLRLFGGEDVEL